jgi:hypothetical protein
MLGFEDPTQPTELLAIVEVVHMSKTILRWCFFPFIVAASAAHGGEYCWNETIKSVIQTDGGGVFFTTDKSCPSWCGANYANADAVKRAYALLLTASASGKKVTFYWPMVSSSCAVVPVYSQPENFMLMN